MRIFKRLLILLIVLPLTYILAVVIIGTLTQYKPESVEEISKLEEGITISDTNVYSVMIWNIGYAGLGAEMDFFYDGGSKVRDSEDNVRRNLYKITEFLQANDTIDFILIQEIDNKSKRSYSINMHKHFNEALVSYFPFMAYNYKVNFVPMPLLNPMGRVNSGLLNLTRYVPTETTRHKFPGNYSWPKNIFMPDRCFLVNKFETKSGKELIIVNTHNSAFDDGSLREQQVNFLKSFLMEEEKKGNTFVVGGDWNQCPPNFKPKFNIRKLDSVGSNCVGEDLLQEKWNVYYDSKIPSNRSVKTAYVKEETPVFLIDFFLTSSNVDVISCKGIDLDFANSDHQPVILSFKLKN